MTDGQYLVVRARKREIMWPTEDAWAHIPMSPAHVTYMSSFLQIPRTACPHYIESDKSGGLDDQYELILLQKYFKFHAPISVDCNQVWWKT